MKYYNYRVFLTIKDFLDVWSDKNASELDLLPILAATLSPSTCGLASFNENIKKNARNYLRKMLQNMEDEDDMNVELDGKAIQAKPVETLDVMAR